MKFGDLLGRRKTIFYAAATATIGAILMASSFSLAQLIVARLILGLGSGGYTATIPVWQSEIAGAEHRGAFVNWVSRFKRKTWPATSRDHNAVLLR